MATSAKAWIEWIVVDEIPLPLWSYKTAGDSKDCCTGCHVASALLSVEICIDVIGSFLYSFLYGNNARTLDDANVQLSVGETEIYLRKFYKLRAAFKFSTQRPLHHLPAFRSFFGVRGLFEEYCSVFR